MCTVHTTAHNILLHITYYCKLHTAAHYMSLHPTYDCTLLRTTYAAYICTLHTCHCTLHTYTAHYILQHTTHTTADCRGQGARGHGRRNRTATRPNQRTVEGGVGAGAAVGAPTNRATSAAAATAAALVGGTSLVGHLIRRALGGKISCGIHGKVSEEICKTKWKLCTLKENRRSGRRLRGI